jgi:histone H3/H4
MEKPSITKPNTVETFMKANSTLRIGSDTISFFLTQLDTLSEAITKAAEANAKKENRTTIMPDDIKAALTSVTGSTSDLPYLFKQLENLTAKDTATISELIQKWIDTH